MSVSEHQDESAVRIEDGALSVKVTYEEAACVAEIGGELDIEVAPMLEAELLRLLDGRAEAVRVNLHDLEYIDSIGLRCLLKVSRAAESSNRILRFSRPRGDVARIMALTKLDQALPFDE